MALAKEHLHNLLLLFICCLFIDAAAKLSTTAPCLPDEASSLLQLKASFIGDNLPSWQAGTDCCHWEGVTCDMAFGRVTSLDLVEADLAGTNVSYDMPSSLANLESLKTLRLSTMGIHNEIPSLSNLTRLTDLELHGYDFSQSVSTWIGKLTRLESLKIEDCSFSVPIPYQIGNLTKLAAVEFSNCDFSEQRMPSWIGNLTKLTSLSISNCNLSGSIPSTIGNLIQLKKLWFWYTDISGKIPKSVFALPVLQHLILIGNNLVGSLEDIPAPLSSPLREIELDDNQLTGPIPKSFFQLTNLERLDLSWNKLTDTIELGSIWRLKSLTYLDLGNNMISLVEKEGDAIFSHSLKVQDFYVASCNLTKFPESLKYLDTIEALDLSNNQIQGAIPSWVWERRLVSLDLSYNMFTSTLEKSSIAQMTDLIDLDLSFNRLQGTIPIPSSPSDLFMLDCSNNNFSYIEPNFGRYLRNANYINLSKNKLSGHIPLSICSLDNLEIMDLSYNYFSGPIPSCLMERVNLSILKLRENKLLGVLPENIIEGCKLQTVDLNGNRIEGALPRSLENCQDLEVFDVGNNQIVDSFPSWMGTLPNLRILVLRSNQLFGTIRDLHSGYQHFPSLQMIDLASNHFFGDLQSEWFDNLRAMMINRNDEGQILEHRINMSPNKTLYQDTVTITFKDAALSITRIQTDFKVIDLSNNSFEGSIPSSIGRLVSLHGLNMSHNNFTGHIPSQLGNLTRLESMDLSCNHLSGEIPQSFTSLTSLSWLNLSYNNLTGRIPLGNQFLSFPSSSFEGNAGLCGIQLSKECDTRLDSTTPSTLAPEPNTLWQDKLDAIIFFMFAGLGFGVGFALAVIFGPFYHIEEWLRKHM